MPLKSVAIIGAGAAGAAAAAALKAEEAFDVIRIFERRSSAGGTWIYDAIPTRFDIHPGALPTEIDRATIPPGQFPCTMPHDARERFENTPIYKELTTNVPDIAMSLSDRSFSYGPFVPHWVPRQYIENYFASHRCDSPDMLVLNTTVEDVSHRSGDRWLLTLRQYDPVNNVDQWWQETFDGLIIANGHYSIPFVPYVKGLSAYATKFHGGVEHSKIYRAPTEYANQRVLIIGNSASGHDIVTQLLQSGLCRGSIYVSRRSRSRWDGSKPPDGIEWKPVISEYTSDGTILFEDGSTLCNMDRVIYCTGYRASFPWWKSKANGRPLWDYTNDILIKNFQHTFVSDMPTLSFIGVPRVLTFRSFEYQAIAIARLWSGNNAQPLPPLADQSHWRHQRQKVCRQEHRRFHQIDWDYGETMDWFQNLYELAGLPRLDGRGRYPPVLGPKTRYAIENIKKYPEHGGEGCGHQADADEEWQFVHQKDTLHFI